MAAKGKKDTVPQAAITPNEAVVAEEGKQPEVDLLGTDTGTGESGSELITPEIASTGDTLNNGEVVAETPATPEATLTKPASTTAKETKAAKDEEKKSKTAEPKELTFPLKAVIHNNTPSLRAFPELGKQSASEIEAYAQNVAVIFSNQQMLDTFVGNLAQLRELNGWKDKVGVLLEGI